MPDPKFTIAGLGLDVSWKVFAIAIIGLVVMAILAVALFAMVAGVKVNVRNVDWFPRWNTTVEAEEEPEERRRIFRDEIEIEIQPTRID